MRYVCLLLASLGLLAACRPLEAVGLVGGGPGGGASPTALTPESWCYKTLGKVECYATAQDVPPDRLVAVAPPARTPPSAEAYRNEVARTR